MATTNSMWFIPRCDFQGTSCKYNLSQIDNDESNEDKILELPSDSPKNVSEISGNDANSTNISHSSEYCLKKFRKHYLHAFPTPTSLDDLQNKAKYYKVCKKEYFNPAIYSFGVNNFLSYASYFCKTEAQGGLIEVISIGSGDGSLENAIITAYEDHFGSKLNITLVDNNPEFKVDYSTVDDLIEKRPDVVRNCVLLIMWPESEEDNDCYDIDSICKLQPVAALTVYEPTGVSGSYEFVRLIRKREAEFEINYSLDNYAIEEVARQEVYVNAGHKVKYPWGDNLEWTTEPGLRAYKFRMAKLLRTD